MTWFNNEGEVRAYLESHVGPLPDDVLIGEASSPGAWNVAIGEHHPGTLVGAVQDATQGTNAQLGWVDPPELKGSLIRATLTYRAPVYVTVNLKTRQVERVYMDDESVQPEPTNEMLIDADNDQAYWGNDRHRLREDAFEIAEAVDWTSTQNRCAVWRGAVGGPENTDRIVDLALGLLHAHLTMAPQGLLDATDAPTPGDVVAVRRYLDDIDTWRAEHAP